MNIFELTSEMAQLEVELEINGGELTPEMEERYAITSEELKNKVDSYNSFLQKKKSEIETISAEIARLTALKKTATNSYDNAKDFFLRAMQMNGLGRIDGAYCKAYTTRRQGVEIVSEAVLTTAPIEDIEAIKEKYPPYIKFDVSISKSELAKYSKENGVPEGCIPKDTVSLTIK